MQDAADAADRPGQFGPDTYAAWRISSLGEIVESLEHRLILRMTGPLRGRTVLDVGCGDGTLAAVFAGDGAARVVGCDPDARMIARARARAGSGGNRLDLAIARSQCLPFPDASFDVVTCITVLAFVPDANAAIAEMARVLRPGGKLVIGDLNKWSYWAARRRIRSWLGAKLWRGARFRTARQLAAMLRDAGLVVDATAGAIFFPPWTALARLCAPCDAQLGNATTLGAAFVAVQAEKPSH